MVDSGVILAVLIPYLAFGLGLALPIVGRPWKKRDPNRKMPCEDDACFCPLSFLFAWFLWPLVIVWFVVFIVVQAARGGARTVCGIPLGPGRGRRKKKQSQQGDVERGERRRDGGDGVVMQQPRPGGEKMCAGTSGEQQVAGEQVPLGVAATAAPSEAARASPANKEVLAPPPAYGA